MNEVVQNEQKDAGAAADAVADAPARMPRAVLAALLLAAAAVLFGATHWLQDRGADDELRRELARRLADMEAQNKEAAARAAQAANALREAEVKLGVLETKLAESQSQQIALEALYQELSRNRDDWAFAEIEQSVLLASQQLQVAANVRAALIGLENAEARLQRLDQPRYAGLKRALSRDIEKLKALPLTDIYVSSARLDDVIAAVDKLPLAMTARAQPESAAPPPAAAEAQGWTRVLREIWGEMRQLVRIQTSGVQDAALLAPDQAFFLRENLRLRLSSARLSLLTRDTRAYQGDLRAVQAALEAHFERKDAAVIAAAATLRKLQEAQLQAELPDLAETMEALRKLRLPRPRAAG
ncbi:MAG: uroporphyrinogen-III C-methyltransferase [Betaproteobacteria bacterium]|jgi:uroporphyrin-3 C-methyltransferase|nr:uroporphyrinogen-III C-methyltransferase [Betaproteobacteria bacterium]